MTLDLNNLENLNLWNSNVKDISDLELLLSRTDIQVNNRSFGDGVLINYANVSVPPYEILTGGRETIIKYLKELKISRISSNTKGKGRLKDFVNTEVKLLLLGNSTAGKTTLREFILEPDGRKSRSLRNHPPDSSHGISEDIWNTPWKVKFKDEDPESLQVRLLDFGGQEYYHDCHHLFFTDRTAYVVLWEKKTNSHGSSPIDVLNDGALETEMIDHHPIEYWLDAISHFVQGSKPKEERLEAFLDAFFQSLVMHQIVAYEIANEGVFNERIIDVDTKGLDIEHFRPKGSVHKKWKAEDFQQLIDSLVASYEERGFSDHDLSEILKNENSVLNEDQRRLTSTAIKEWVFSHVQALVVQNKISDDGKIFLNNQKLQDQFPFIHDFAHIDIYDQDGTKYLEHEQLKKMLSGLSLVGSTQPGIYGPVIDAVKKVKDIFLDREEFTKLFEKTLDEYGLTPDQISQANFEEYMRYTGQWLLFNERGAEKTSAEKDSIEDLIVLQPVKLIDRIYSVLNKGLIAKRGEFSFIEAEKIIKGSFYKKGTKAKVEKHTRWMLQVMERFRIVFRMHVKTDESSEEVYVAPQYLPQKPGENIRFAKSLHHFASHRFKYDGYIHKSIIMHFFSEYGRFAKPSEEKPQEIRDYHIWKDGILIQKDFGQEKQSVLVEFNQKEACTYLYPFHTQNTTSALLVEEIRKCFHEIHERRRVSEQVSCDGKTFVSIRELQKALDNKAPKLHSDGRWHRVANYHEFLDHEFLRRKIFISYSSKDVAFVRELKAHLAPMQRKGMIETWYDRDIGLGQNWDDEIKSNLRSSNVILFIVSSDFINSDYIWDIEVKEALKLNKSKDCRIIPIVVRSCDWTNDMTPFSHIQAANKGKAISSEANRDEAWTNVVVDLKYALSNLDQDKFPKEGE